MAVCDRLVIGMCFNVTATNTGKRNGACRGLPFWRGPLAVTCCGWLVDIICLRYCCLMYFECVSVHLLDWRFWFSNDLERNGQIYNITNQSCNQHHRCLYATTWRNSLLSSLNVVILVVIIGNFFSWQHTRLGCTVQQQYASLVLFTEHVGWLRLSTQWKLNCYSMATSQLQS